MIKNLNKKIHVFENMSSEFYGLISMPIHDIFKGVALMEEQPEYLWDIILEEFGDRFFFPVIEKLYAPLFIEDIKFHQKEIMKAVAQTTVNEQLVVDQCKLQLQDAERQKLEAEE